MSRNQDRFTANPEEMRFPDETVEECLRRRREAGGVLPPPPLPVAEEDEQAEGER
jgi:hypothetical protein